MKGAFDPRLAFSSNLVLSRMRDASSDGVMNTNQHGETAAAAAAAGAGSESDVTVTSWKLILMIGGVGLVLIIVLLGSVYLIW